jgi:hypothetical protein
MTVNVIQFSTAPGLDEILRMIDELRHRAFAGDVIGLALVEHRAGGDVTYEVFGPVSYHHLTSGAARLAHHLASQEHDE